MNKTANLIQELNQLTQLVFEDKQLISRVDEITLIIIDAFKSGNQVFFCGNGGSAAEAQHLSAELSGKFKLDRRPLPAEACHTNPSFLTAVSNDYNFEKSYERYIEAFGKKGDVLIGLSTSGNSANIVNAFTKAQLLKIKTVALTGKTGGNLKDFADYIISIPSENVPRIQEMHLLIGHIICEKVEEALFSGS